MINQVRQKISGNPAEVNDNRAKLVSTMNDDTDVKATYPHQYEKLVRSAVRRWCRKVFCALTKEW